MKHKFAVKEKYHKPSNIKEYEIIKFITSRFLPIFIMLVLKQD